MTDHERIESQLHDAAAEVRVDTGLPSKVRRGIRIRKFGTVATSLLVVIVLVSGATYAVANFTRTSTDFGPTDQRGNLGPSVGWFSAEFEVGKVTVIADGETELLCAAVGEIDEDATISRIEVVGPGVLVPISPSEEEVDGVDPDFKCIGDVPEDFVRAMTGSPDLYSLAIDGSHGTEEIPLQLTMSEEAPDRDRCMEIPFEATYVPEGWSREVQPGSAVGDLEMVAGHLGPPGEPGAQKLALGFLDIIPSLGTFEQKPDDADIEVLGSLGSLSGPNDRGGYGVRFGHDGCIYQLGGSLDLETIKAVAEGLKLRDPGGRDG